MRSLHLSTRVLTTFLVVLFFSKAQITSAYDLNALGWDEIKRTLEPYGWDWDESSNKFTMNVTRGGVRIGEKVLNRIDMDGAEYRTVDAGNGDVMLTKNGCQVFSIKKQLTWRAMFFGVFLGAFLAVPTALFAGPIAGKLAGKLAGGKLNGAAASSHALAYVGTWVGGGMTAGSVLLTSLAGAFGAVIGAITNLSYVLSCQ